MSLHDEEKYCICLVFLKVLSFIYISYDSWTTPNVKEIFEIISYFIDEERKLQVLLLAMIEDEGAYTSKQLAAQMFEVLD